MNRAIFTRINCNKRRFIVIWVVKMIFVFYILMEPKKHVWSHPLYREDTHQETFLSFFCVTLELNLLAIWTGCPQYMTFLWMLKNTWNTMFLCQKHIKLASLLLFYSEKYLLHSIKNWIYKGKAQIDVYMFQHWWRLVSCWCFYEKSSD